MVSINKTLPLAAVTGLTAEARIARSAGWAAVATGGDRIAIRAAIVRLLAQGPRTLVSFGIAGGLAPELRPGTVIIADRVVGATAAPLAESAALARRHGFVTGAVAAPTAIATTAAEKRALRDSTGAIAVDLESGLVAEAGVPFIVLRAIADPAERDLPPAALVGLRDDGAADLPRVLASIARHPGQLPALIRVARDSRAALRALARAALVVARTR